MNKLLASVGWQTSHDEHEQQPLLGSFRDDSEYGSVETQNRTAKSSNPKPSTDNDMASLESQYSRLCSKVKRLIEPDNAVINKTLRQHSGRYRGMFILMALKLEIPYNDNELKNKISALRQVIAEIVDVQVKAVQYVVTAKMLRRLPEEIEETIRVVLRDERVEYGLESTDGSYRLLNDYEIMRDWVHEVKRAEML